LPSAWAASGLEPPSKNEHSGGAFSSEARGCRVSLVVPPGGEAPVDIHNCVIQSKRYFGQMQGEFHEEFQEISGHQTFD